LKYIIAGLGNIGEEYKETRHNIGFMVLDALAKASNIFFEPGRYASIAETKIKGRTLLLVKPSTYMNLSGKAIRYWLEKEKIPLENLLVVCDDLALPLGSLRLRPKGGDGGHNGLANIEEILGANTYARLRVGIGDIFSKGNQVDYVLSKFSDEELKLLAPRLDLGIDTIKSFATIGLERTMTLYNNK